MPWKCSNVIVKSLGVGGTNAQNIKPCGILIVLSFKIFEESPITRNVAFVVLASFTNVSFIIHKQQYLKLKPSFALNELQNLHEGLKEKKYNLKNPRKHFGVLLKFLFLM